MKLNKLLVSSALILVLGLGACNTKKSDGPVEPSSSEQESESGSESQIEPVSLINIEDPGTIIVGQQIDLDDYVTIVGGEGPKVFDVQVPSTMTELVEVEGHKLTALAEETINVKIIAGAKEAKFSADAMSQLRNELREVLEATNDGYAMQQIDWNDDGSFVPGDANIHHSDYYAGPQAVKDDAGNWTYGGMLKAENGKTYEFIMDDMAGTNLFVRPSVLSDFGHWSTNISIDFSVKTLEYVHEEENDYEYFLLNPGTVTLPNGWDGVFKDYVSLLSSALFDVNPDQYVSYYTGSELGPISFEKIDISETETAFDVTVYFIMNNKQYSIAEGYFIVDDVPEVEPVRTYIDEGNAPAAIDFEDYANTIDSIIESKNYKVDIVNGWFNSSTLELADYVTAISALTGKYAYSWEEAWPDATETRIVTDNGFYYNFQETYHFDAETTEALETPVLGDPEIGGAINHDGGVYQFNKDAEGYKTSAVDGATDLWADLGNYVAAGLEVSEDFAVSSRDEDASGTIVYQLDQTSASELFPALVRQSSNGAYIEAALNQAFEGDYLDYITTYAFVSEGSLTMMWLMRAGGSGYFGQKITFSAIGGGNALPVTEAELFGE